MRYRGALTLLALLICFDPRLMKSPHEVGSDCTGRTNPPSDRVFSSSDRSFLISLVRC